MCDASPYVIELGDISKKGNECIDTWYKNTYLYYARFAYFKMKKY